MLDSLVAELEIVTRDAVSFHTEKYNCYQGITIQSAVSRTVKQASRIGHILEIDLRQDCIDFRQSITRNNFDRTAHKPLDMDNPMILEIIDLSFVLRDRLETAFQDKYTFS